MNLDIKQVYRLTYGVLDLISDIGGVYILIFSLLAFILGMWNYNYVDNYMVSRLYRMESESESGKETQKMDNENLVPKLL